MGFDVVGVALVDIVPSVAHAVNFGGIVELAEEGFFEFSWGGAGDDASGVHVRIAGASETEVDNADDFVVFIEENVAEVEVAVDEFFQFSFFDVGVVGVDVLVVMLVVEFF